MATISGGTAEIILKIKSFWAMAGIPDPFQAFHGVLLNDTLSVGTGTGKVDLAPFGIDTTIASGTNDTYNLAAYTPPGAAAAVTTMTKCKLIGFKNIGDTSLDVGGEAVNPLIGAGFLKGATDKITTVPGQVLFFWIPVGLTVNPGGARNIDITEIGAALGRYKLFFAGSST